INSNLFAIISQTVIDGAITQAKLAPAVTNQLIPSGMIAMFASSCPTSGWTEFTNLSGRFPVGADYTSYKPGDQGGLPTHSHSLATGQIQAGTESGVIGTHTSGADTVSLLSFTLGPGGNSENYQVKRTYTDSQSNVPHY